MESINVEFVQNLLASYKEIQESYYALQNRMAAFEAMASAKFEDYEAKLAEKDTVIASLKSEVADLTKKLERYREKDKTNSHMSPSSDKTKSAHKNTHKNTSGRKPGAQQGHKGSGMSLPAPYDRQEITSLTPKPCQSCPIRFVCSSLACARVSAVRMRSMLLCR